MKAFCCIKTGTVELILSKSTLTALGMVKITLTLLGIVQGIIYSSRRKTIAYSQVGAAIEQSPDERNANTKKYNAYSIITIVQREQ